VLALGQQQHRDLYATQAINRRDGGLRGESIRYLRRYRLQDWLVAQGADRRKAHPLRMSITTSWLVRTGASPSFDDVRNERRCGPSATKQHGAFAAPRVTFQNMAFSALVTVG
jgi:hypothetical protein